MFGVTIHTHWHTPMEEPMEAVKDTSIYGLQGPWIEPPTLLLLFYLLKQSPSVNNQILSAIHFSPILYNFTESNIFHLSPFTLFLAHLFLWKLPVSNCSTVYCVLQLVIKCVCLLFGGEKEVFIRTYLLKSYSNKNECEQKEKKLKGSVLVKGICRVADNNLHQGVHVVTNVCLFVGLSAALDVIYWRGFYKIWMEDGSQPMIDPVKFWCGSA